MLVFYRNEPSYQGKRLSDWAREYGTNKWSRNANKAEMAEVAIRHIGAEGVPFLLQAIESVRAQTLKNIEIILINDGSTDNSMQIIEEQAAQDSRIRVLSQENQGNSAARNNAFKEAKGRYVYFMDSDDVIEGETLEACLVKCEAHQLDFVFF